MSARRYQPNRSLRAPVWIGVSICVVAAFCGPLLAQDDEAGTTKRDLSLMIEQLSSSIRGTAPVPLRCTLQYRKSTLLEGHLHLVLHEGHEAFARVRIDDIALTGGDYEFRTLIPPIPQTHNGLLDVDAWFETESGKIPLETLPLFVPVRTQRYTTMAMCLKSRAFVTPDQTALTDTLRLNRFNPQGDVAQTAQTNGQIVGFFTAKIDPDEMPNDAVSFCAFDIVSILDGGLGELRQKQLDALRRWLDAGGSLCLRPDGILEPHHLKFLNDLAQAGGIDDPFTLDRKGRVIDTGDLASVRLFRSGLGRVALLSPNESLASLLMPAGGNGVPEPTVAANEMTDHLWKVRKGQPVAEGRAWIQYNPAEPDIEHDYQRRNWETTLVQRQKLYHQHVRTLPRFLERMMPQDVRMVPLGLIGLILFLYVLAVGPGDYVLLGMIKRRRWTWFLFPFVTLAFTMFTVTLSNAYMRTTDSGRTTMIADIGQSGQVLRSSVFNLVFSGTRTTKTTEARSSLFCAINHREFGGDYYWHRGRPSPSMEAFVKSPQFSGRLPSRYAASQEIPQWTPQLNRIFTIAPDDVDPGTFDWSRTDDVYSPDPQALKQRVLQAFPDAAHVVLYEGDAQNELVGTDVFISNRYYGYVEFDDHSRSFLDDICVRPGYGFFQLVSRTAPTGGANFEDLTLLDPTNPDERLLVVVVEQGDVTRVYRRLYSGTDG